MENPQKIKELFTRYLKDECSPEEVQLLLSYFNANENTTLLKSLILQLLESTSTQNADSDLNTKATLDDLLSKIQKKIRKKN